MDVNAETQRTQKNAEERIISAADERRGNGEVSEREKTF